MKTRNQAGQAMVEFCLMLIIILGLCAGMLQLSNLVNYDFWAQQDARYSAFEQVWYVDSSADVNDDNYFRRPKSVRRLDQTQDVADEGSLSTLLAYAKPGASNRNLGATSNQAVEAPIMLARKSNKDSIWHRKTKDWYRDLDRKLSVVDTAYASLRGLTNRETGGDALPPQYDPTPRVAVDAWQEHSVATGIRKALETTEFGEDYCASAAAVIRRHGFPAKAAEFENPDCAPSYNREFALHLSENVDFRDVFRDYEYQLDGGVSQTEALDTALRTEVANQFYSFFDTSVSLARIGAVPAITAERGLQALEVADPSILRMVTDLRYVGSSVAVTALSVGQFANVLGVSPTNRDPLVEKNLADTVFGVLLADVTDAGFLLNPLYLPVPPSFLGSVGAIQNAAMENVLRGGQNDLGPFLGDPDGDESGLIGPLIDDSNKESVVLYDSGKGVVPAAARRFSANATLTSRFFLVTQPWHITRRESPSGSFRTLGDQFDGIGENTEEGVLRRRVAGLWLFPSAPTAFFEAPFQAAGLGAQLSGAFDAVSGLDSVISNLKNVVFLNNPIAQLFDVLSQIPLLGGLVPTFPKFPTVRPTAYPGSTELRGQSFVPDDEMAGEPRNFSDYIDEQRSNDPDPNPEFDNSTFE